MQTETKMVEGWQQQAKQGDMASTPSPALPYVPATTDEEVPDELRKLYRAIHGGLDNEHMTWVK